MPNYRICAITEDNHIASAPVTTVCDDDRTAVQHSQKLLDRNDIQLWQGRRLVTRLNESGLNDEASEARGYDRS
jgi:hypothetical protein